MPELPEVETVRRVLERRFAGRRVDSVTIGRPTFYRRPCPAAVAALAGGVIRGFGRRGKFLLVRLVGRQDVVFHLGMSGRLTVGEPGPHVRLELSIGGETLRFHDSRRFGRVGCALPKLGPEPLDAEFGPAALREVLRGRRAPVKALIMDQRLVAGLGNIYATEALHRAGVRPGRAGGSLSRAETERLAAACREVLLEGIALGGSTLDDRSYLDPLGRPGRMQDSVRVYGRGECGTCGRPLLDTRRSIGGRASLYCPACQA